MGGRAPVGVGGPGKEWIFTCRPCDRPRLRNGKQRCLPSPTGFEVTGVEFARAAIDKARAKAGAAGVHVDFIVDQLTDLRQVSGTFDLLVDYGVLDDLRDRDRDLYVRNVLPLAHPKSRFLLWCFEWPERWWERLRREQWPCALVKQSGGSGLSSISTASPGSSVPAAGCAATQPIS